MCSHLKVSSYFDCLGWVLMILTFVMQFTLILGKSSSNVWKFDEGASLPLNATAQQKATNVYSSVSTLYM